MTRQKKNSTRRRRLFKAVAEKNFFQACFVWLIAGYMHLIRVTTRWAFVFHPETRELLEKSSNVIICFWHGRLPIMPKLWHLAPESDLHVLTSLHRDGRLISDAIKKLNFQTVAGSSYRGGATALIQMKRILAEGKGVCITPDGPKGPRMRVKLGAIKAAQLSGRPIVSASGSMSWARFLETWDRFCLPALFSQGTIRFGAPLYVPHDANSEQLEEMRLTLEQRLNALTRECDCSMRQSPIAPAPLDTEE